MESERLKARYKVIRILWFALFVTNFLYLAMLHMPQIQERAPDMPPHLPELVGALSLGIAIISFVLPARAFDLALRNMTIETRDNVGEVVGSFRESAPVEKVAADPDGAMADAIGRFQRPMLIGMALAESITMFGFLVGYHGGKPYAYAPFFAVSFGLMVAKFPRTKTITRAIERVKGVRIAR